MTTLAFCGLGQMGTPMAARLLEAGHELVVWNRSPGRTEALVEAGAKEASSPAEAAASAEAAFTMLATPEALEEVVLGAAGLAEGLAEGSTVIDMSTVGPDAVREVARQLGDGRGMLDAPVLGSVTQATEGTLKVFVGGDEAAYERWRPVLAVLGSPTLFGPIGAGAAMKLVANTTLGAVMTALGEALALADALGLDQDAVLDVLAESPVGATVRSKRDKIEGDTYDPNFKLSLAAKDLRLVEDAAGRAGLDLRVAVAARRELEAAEEAGLGDLDYSAVIAHLRRRQAQGSG